MSDRDTGHTLNELQEARAEVDRLRRAIAKHRQAMAEYKGAFYDLELWKVLDSTAYDEAGGEAGWVVDGLQKMNQRLNDLLRWRDAYGDPPTEHGSYFVINHDFEGGTSIHVARWDDKWPIGFTISYWRPIGPLPGGE